MKRNSLVSLLCLLAFTGMFPQHSMARVMTAGNGYSEILCGDGTIRGWGDNSLYQLGDGTAEEYFGTEIIQALGLAGITAVSAGDGFTVALEKSGSVWAWGYRASVTTSPQTHVPLQIETPGVVRAVSAGAFDGFGNSFLVLTGDGAVWNITLGFAGANASLVRGIGEVTAISSGRNHSLALRNDGTVWQWTSTNPAPVMIGALDEVVAIAAGGDHSLALGSDGALWSWGANAHGQLGDGTTINRTAPVRVDITGEIAAIAAGHRHSLAVKRDGTVWSWGRNTHGQLGDGGTADRSLPGQVDGLTDITAVAAGPGQSLALGQDGTVYNWGATSAYDITYHPVAMNVYGLCAGTQVCRQ